MTVDDVVTVQTVIPVITIDRARDAAPLAETLVRSGLSVLEVTLRTPAASEAIREMTQVKGAIVGAGTVVSARDVDKARGAGATFIVTPGLSRAVVAAAASAGLPVLAGVATATEIMAGLDLGLNRFKFFPAEQAGGVRMLDAFRGPFGDVRFCPTGGITPELARDYLSRSNVACVGGSWMCRQELVLAGRWDEIAALARAAAGLQKA